MSDKMTPISFEKLLKQSLKEFKETGCLYYVPVWKDRTLSPVGPAAGPHTQLAQNILAAYAAGAQHFELKTVQILVGEELGIVKPCIYVKGEAYNTEWSTELTVKEAFEEYVKAWYLIHVLSEELGLKDADKVVFYVSVGYNLEGISTPIVDGFINDMKDACNTEIWKECVSYCKAHLDLFANITEEYLDLIPSKICNTITLSTMHGCPPEEIEKIAVHLLKEKELSLYIKCNPTLVGYDKSCEILDDLGYGYITLSKSVFSHDITYPDLVGIIKRMLTLAKECGRTFGVKLTNTFPVKITGNELTGDAMYMSGPPLYPFSINVAAMMSKEFNGELQISYSGGADVNNIADILETGIYPVTVSTLLLKQGGYKNLTKLNKIAVEKGPFSHDKINVENVTALANKAISDTNYAKELKERKVLDNPEYSPLCAKCTSCVDVCPNRCNKTILINGEKITVHMDDLCNECGNCQHFCIYGHNPYKEKITIFGSKDSFGDSENTGIFVSDEVILLRGLDTNKADYYKEIYKKAVEI